MSPFPSEKEKINSIWFPASSYVVQNKQFDVLTTCSMPIFDFDTYSNFRKSDIISDIKRAFKDYKIQYIARLYYTCNGVRMILPYTSFNTEQLDDFISKVPHMDALYIKYLKASNLYRARLSIKFPRVPKNMVFDFMLHENHRVGMCRKNHVAVTSYIYTLNGDGSKLDDEHKFLFKQLNEKPYYMTSSKYSNCMVPNIFLNSFEWSRKHGKSSKIFKKRFLTVLRHDIITGSYCRGFTLL